MEGWKVGNEEWKVGGKLGDGEWEVEGWGLRSGRWGKVGGWGGGSSGVENEEWKVRGRL